MASLTPEIQALVMEAASEFGVDPSMIMAMINQESAGNAGAVSPKGAQGLMQLMPATAQELGVKNILDPRENIRGGTQYIAKMLKQFGGDRSKALAAYNAGPGAVTKHGGIPPFPETQNYVQRIMAGLSPEDPLGASKPPAVSPGPAPVAPIAPPSTPMSRVGAGMREAGGAFTRALGETGKAFGGAYDSIMSRIRPDTAAAGPGAPPPGIDLPTPRPAPFPTPPPARAALPPAPAPAPTVDPRALRESEEYVSNNFFRPGILDAPRGDFQVAPSAPRESGSQMASQAPGESMPPAVAERALRTDPSVIDMLIEHLGNTPTSEQYEPRGWRKAVGALGAGLAGAVSGPEAGLRTAEHFKSSGYNRALQEHGAKTQTLGVLGRMEEATADRALREREYKLREGDSESMRTYRDRMGRAATERADKYGNMSRTGAQKPVPVGQQHQAWQMAAARLYALDKSARKYLVTYKEGNKTVYDIEPFKEGRFFDTEHTPEEEKEKKLLMDKIDEMAQEYIGTMVDPYDRERRPSGFGYAGMDDQ